MSTEADAILEEAYRILSEEKEWCQGEMYRPRGEDNSLGQAEAVCLSGALVLAMSRVMPAGSLDHTNEPLVCANRRFFAAAGLPNDPSGFGAGVTWNDDPHRTKEDVLLTLKRARWDFGDDQ